jgi:leucine dehydrogenase
LNDETIPLLKCQIVAGSANNQLAEQYHANALEEREILYAPDYLINSGGLINVSYEGPNYDLQEVMTHVGKIY